MVWAEKPGTGRKIPFARPDLTQEEIDAVAAVLRSGWITTGPRTRELEQKLAAFTGADHCVCMSSQTACAEMALRVLGIGPGDEVITSAYTYTATAAVIAHTGARIVLADTLRDSPMLDPAAVERAVTCRTKAILPVDVGGVPCPYEDFYAIAEEKRRLFRPESPMQEALGRIAISADTAHSLGAERKGRPSGSLADFSSFSFHAAKNLTTAEGGALTWKSFPGVDSEDLYRRLRCMSLHGQNRDALEKQRTASWEYDVLGTWYKCNMTDLQGALGLVQLKRYPAMLEKRRKLMELCRSVLEPGGIWVLPHEGEDFRSSCHLCITRVPWLDRRGRDELFCRMAERGVECNVHFKPLPLLTAYRALGFDIAEFPNALDFFSNEITLPLCSSMEEEEMLYGAECLAELAEELRP